MRYNKRIQGGENVAAYNKTLVDIPDDEGVHVITPAWKYRKSSCVMNINVKK